MMNKKIILHLCADIGSDSTPYQDHDDYEVILVGKEIGVENFNPPENVYGVIANPVCTEFSTVRTGGFERFKNNIHDDNGFRSLCSQGFAKAFFEVNR